MDPFTLLLLAAGAYLATRKKTPPPTPTPSGGGDAIKPNDQGPGAPIDVKKDNGGNTSESLKNAKAQKKILTILEKAIKTGNFSQIPLSELNKIDVNKLPSAYIKAEFLKAKTAKINAEKNKNVVVIKNNGPNRATTSGGTSTI